MEKIFLKINEIFSNLYFLKCNNTCHHGFFKGVYMSFSLSSGMEMLFNEIGGVRTEEQAWALPDSDSVGLL